MHYLSLATVLTLALVLPVLIDQHLNSKEERTVPDRHNPAGQKS